MNDNWKNKLPQRSPKNVTWKQIEDELNFDEWIVQANKILPVHQVKNNAWDLIEKQLNSDVKKRVFAPVSRQHHWLAAASVFVLLTLGWWVVSPAENIEITHSTEVVINNEVKIETTDLKEIDERCKELVVVCNTLEVKDLRAEIEALSEESEALLQQAEIFGNDVKILQAQQKIEAQKTEMVKRLIELMDHENNS